MSDSWLAWLVVSASIVGCAAPTQPVTRPAPCRAVTPAAAAPKVVAPPPDCTADSQCQTRGAGCVVNARCVDSKCQLQLMPPHTRCELSGMQESYQNLYISERGEAGICRQGTCIPRMQCAELCAVSLGPALWKTFKAELDECKRQKPDSGMLCNDEVASGPKMQAEAKRVTDRCLVDCGFPDLDAM